jgi:hypothetical protein
MLPKELLLIISSYINHDTNDAASIIEDTSQVKFTDNDYKTILKLRYPDLYGNLMEPIKDFQISLKSVNYVLSKIDNVR